MTPEERAKVLAEAQAPSDQPAQKPTKEKTPTKPQSKPKKEDLEVFDVKSKSERYTQYATGKVRNNTDHKYNYVQVEINLLDVQGNIVGSTLANVNNLEPGKVFAFKAVVLDSSAKTFEVKGVTGF